MRAWLRTDPRFADRFEHVWLWEDFPARQDFGGKDTGIDLVAKTHDGDYWAIQCKCYAEDAVIDKPSVDSFLATSSRTFTNEVTFQTTSFAHRLWISTTNRWGANAEEAIQNQNLPVSRVNLFDLDHSSADWGKLFEGLEGKAALAGKNNSERISEKPPVWIWIVASIISIIDVILIGVWLINGNHQVSNENLSPIWMQIVGKISMIPLLVTATVFCAKQYTKQRNLLEDYAYKQTLTQSMVAFSEELRGKDSERHREYLSMVLNEVLQDPLRHRVDPNSKNKADSNISEEALKLTERFFSPRKQ
jgi:hypothetical protein